MIKNSGHQVHYSRIGNFEVEGALFEVGGRDKSLKQIGRNLNRAYLVKDDILYGGKHEIPLYLLAFFTDQGKNGGILSNAVASQDLSLFQQSVCSSTPSLTRYSIARLAVDLATCSFSEIPGVVINDN